MIFSSVQDFLVKVYDLNDMIVEKLSDAIILSYDKVNARISVALLFPEPICVKVSITFKGRKIPNGEFDVIVLSSSDTTLVHKNISKRNICYEAKLLNVLSHSNKLKPRKVLCYIGPKQVNHKFFSFENRQTKRHKIIIINLFEPNFFPWPDYDQRENSEIHSKAHSNISLVPFHKSMIHLQF